MENSNIPNTNLIPPSPQINIQNLKPFPRFCMSIGAIPTSYMYSLSYEEQLLWLCKFLQDTVIPAVNNNGQAVAELQALYIQLKDYVDNYFTNLDVQQEINKKLDEMAESGELTEIIAQYLQLAGILAFNTVSIMKNAQNLANGSFCKTYGKITYNDGFGAFYKIRTLINTDVIDDDNLVALTNYPTLVAEKMPNNIIGNLSNLNTENKTNIVNAINEVNTKVDNIEIKVLPNKPFGMKHVIIIGDSYASRTDNWVTPLIQKLGLNENEYYVSAKGSTGFVSASEGKTFITLLTDVINTLSQEEKENITHVIVAGRC